MRRDLIVTFGVQFIIVVVGLLVFKLVNYYFGSEGFSEFALSRRTITLMYPILLLGLGVSIPRYIAFAESSADAKSKKPDHYLTGGLLIIIPIIIVFFLIFILLRETAADLLFGSSEYVFLIIPLSIAAVGYVLHALSFGYLRGRMMITSANLLYLVNFGIIPLVAVFLGKSVAQVILISGLANLLFSLTALLIIIKTCVEFEWPRYAYVKELLVYGIPRTPQAIAMPALLRITGYICRASGWSHRSWLCSLRDVHGCHGLHTNTTHRNSSLAQSKSTDCQ